ncbi:radical SAM/SPASM domain-containing protein [Marinifilum flexuosum]|uniref:radical SAM/SPASM domain-containing protein n=1 Tax=Marinifilum flexuosum TaxID=1117708 RepID=UPI002492D731|nr:radical SAM protein [Marinifilum flexuosum]
MKLKTSEYIYTSPITIKDKFKLIYSTRSGQLLVIPKSYLSQKENKISIDMNKLSKEYLLGLKDKSFLVPENENEIETVVENALQSAQDTEVLYKIISLSANCQLACKYCGQSNYNKNISENFYSSIEERIVNNLKTNQFKQLKIGWFGGEPLLAIKTIKNFSEKFIVLAEKFNCSYEGMITTNGYSLSLENFKLLRKYKVNVFEVTIDGPKTTHDKRRNLKNGSGSFDKIISNLKSIHQYCIENKENPTINIRCNIDKENQNDIEELITYLHDNKLFPLIRFYIAPIIDWGNDASKNSLSKKEFSQLHMNTIKHLKENDIKSVFPFFPTAPKLSLCTLTSEYGELYDVEGNIYKCTETSYVDAYQDKLFNIGSLKEPFKKYDHNLRKDWYAKILNGELKCSTCKFYPLCGGGCPKSWMEGEPPCPSFVYNFEERLLTYFYMTRTDNQVSNKKQYYEA